MNASRKRKPRKTPAGGGLRKKRMPGGTAGKRAAARTPAPDPAWVRAFADAAPLMVWISDRRGGCTYVNKEWRGFTGGTLRTERGEGWIARVHPKDVPSLRQTFRSALDAGQPFKTESRVRRADGEYRLFSLIATPRYLGGRFQGYIGYALELTLQSRNRHKLQASERRYRQLAEGIGEMFFATDTDFRCVYWNHRLEQLTRIPATKAIGQKVSDVLPHTGTAVMDFLREVQSSGRSQRMEYSVPANGHRTLWELRAVPSPTGLMVIMKDLSGHHDPGSIQGRTEESYQTLFESANDAIIIVEPSSHAILEANRKACELYGFSHAELIGKSSLSVSKEPARGEEHIRRTLEQGSLTDFDTVHLRRDGSAIQLSVNSSVIEFLGSRAILCVNRDASSQKEADEYFSLAIALQDALCDEFHDAGFMIDDSGRIVVVNKSARALTGHEAVELTSMLFKHLVAEKDRDSIRRSLEQAQQGGEVECEGTMLTKGAEELSVQLHFKGVEIGGQRYVRTILRETAGPTQTRRRLQLSKDRYRAFVEQSMDGIWRLEVEQPIPVDLPEEDQIDHLYRYGFVAEANDAFARLHGRAAADQILGARLDEFMPRSEARYVESLRAFVRSGYRVIDAESRSVTGAGVVRYYQTTLFGTVENTRLVHAWGQQRDITERLHTERKLRLLAQTIASAKDCVYLTDLNDTVLYVNDAFVDTYGYAEEDLLGQNIAAVWSPDVTADVAERIHPATLSGGWYGELLSRRKNGVSFPVELWTSLVRNDEGEPVAIVGVARDITERKRAEEQIQTSLREKEVLLKEIHHRVKNNLQVVSSLLNLQSEYIQDPDMKRIFKESQFRVRSMALVHEKLYRSANLAEVNLAEYVSELATELFRSFGAGVQGVSLRIDVDEVSLGIDRAIPCGIILNELMTNALKYGFQDGRGGVVYVELHSDEAGTGVLIVGDTGVGIPDHVDVLATESLGLKLVNMLTEQLQGSLTLVRNSVRNGATGGAEFVIQFPAT